MNSRRAALLSWSLLTLCLVLSATAFAAEPRGSASVDREFAMMDASGDGKISADEHAAGARKMFETMDANEDGKVTAAEMDAAHEQVTGRKAKKTDMSSVDKIKVIDTDGDGRVSAEEHAGGSRSMFERMDADEDGFLTRTELAAGHQKMMGKGR
jgi:Ca2+-binding EF-hand superfamily protein